jgi:lysophospholipase L1-like esterase
MSRAARARKIAIAAAYGGGGVGALGALAYGVLQEQAKRAHRTVGPVTTLPPHGDGIWGHGRGEPIRLAVLGDSGAAGLGVDRAIETPGVLVASGLSELAGRRVRLTNVAKVGATSAHLHDQVDRVMGAEPEVALIIVGTNDVKERMRPAESVRYLVGAVERLRKAGADVVVGTCPDLGTIRPVAQPLRTLARYWSRQLAAAQTIAVVEAGGVTVSLGDILGPEFAARPAEMFSPDRFHPSAEGYAAAAAVLLPSVCTAVGVWPEGGEPLRPFRDRARPVARAAARAAGHPGTEVSATEVAGSEHGPRGRWALPRRRRPRPMPEPSEADRVPVDRTPASRRPDGVRPDSVRPDSARPDGVRPDSVRPTGTEDGADYADPA